MPNRESLHELIDTLPEAPLESTRASSTDLSNLAAKATH
jgi:hypothetical protein